MEWKDNGLNNCGSAAHPFNQGFESLSSLLFLPERTSVMPKQKETTSGIRGVRSRCITNGPEPKMFTIRFPKGMYFILAKIAEDQKVSMNSLGVRFLWQGISAHEQFEELLKESSGKLEVESGLSDGSNVGLPPLA